MVKIKVDLSELISLLDVCKEDVKEIENQIDKFNKKYSFFDIDVDINFNEKEFGTYALKILNFGEIVEIYNS